MAQVTLGSKWKWKNDARVWVVIERKPFGRVDLKQIDRAYFCEVQQKSLLQNATQITSD